MKVLTHSRASPLTSRKGCGHSGKAARKGWFPALRTPNSEMARPLSNCTMRSYPRCMPICCLRDAILGLSVPSPLPS
ncbi:hypothetical protein PAXRUDRAFT_833671 [Paxillus rubicundulus Ve08.2h10]|uniref:Uncharacterized protein n=1 Tax=Paxillus rubicundulus Ve08.2h10 TaxID=930991 RepID=A0A0D0DG67_9AGAM|nr:hypothetical protein PAXRUDRAFT_833671 [Paxillus rubicundulus Ve08.2h10]